MKTSLAGELAGELESAVAALGASDAERLEAIERRIRKVTVRQLASGRSGLSDMSEMSEMSEMPGLLERHALLGQLLEATEANLKVLVSVLHLDAGREMR